MEKELTHETVFFGKNMYITTEEEGKISFQLYKKRNPKLEPVKFYGKFDFNKLKHDLIEKFKYSNLNVEKKDILSFVKEQKNLGNANYTDIIPE